MVLPMLASYSIYGRNALVAISSPRGWPETAAEREERVLHNRLPYVHT